MGHYDIYSMLAEAHGWTPEQVNRMDPEYIENELARLAAKQRHANEQHRQQQRRLRRKGLPS